MICFIDIIHCEIFHVFNVVVIPQQRVRCVCARVPAWQMLCAVHCVKKEQSVPAVYHVSKPSFSQHSFILKYNNWIKKYWPEMKWLILELRKPHWHRFFFFFNRSCCWTIQNIAFKLKIARSLRVALWGFKKKGFESRLQLIEKALGNNSFKPPSHLVSNQFVFCGANQRENQRLVSWILRIGCLILVRLWTTEMLFYLWLLRHTWTLSHYPVN